MNHATFVSEGYYYNGGMELVEPGMVLKQDVDGTIVYYKLIWDEEADRVYLEQYGSDEPIDLDPHASRDRFRAMFPVPEEEQREKELHFSH